jgi:DNA repair photolyase
MEEVIAKTILQRSKPSMDGWIYQDYNMNLYRGCSHGCIYCDSRSLCYGINNFDIVKAKKNAINILELELMRKRIKGVCGMGSMSDPYNPLEKKLELTRAALKLFYRYGFGTSVITKSSLVARDLDIYKKLNENNSVLINITITTADETLQKIIEPRASTTLERFETLKKFSEAGIKAGIILTPILPYINDSVENLDRIIELSKKYKVNHIYAIFGMTLRDIQRDHYYKYLDKCFPGIKEKYISKYGNSYSCSSPNSNILYAYLAKKCKENNILFKIKDINKDFLKRPEQLALEL